MLDEEEIDTVLVPTTTKKLIELGSRHAQLLSPRHKVVYVTPLTPLQYSNHGASGRPNYPLRAETQKRDI